MVMMKKIKQMKSDSFKTPHTMIYTHMSTVTAQPYEIALQGAAESPLDENFPETTTYDSVNLPTQPPPAAVDDDDNRQMYNVLNRNQANGV